MAASGKWAAQLGIHRLGSYLRVKLAEAFRQLRKHHANRFGVAGNDLGEITTIEAANRLSPGRIEPS